MQQVSSSVAHTAHRARYLVFSNLPNGCEKGPENGRGSAAGFDR